MQIKRIILKISGEILLGDQPFGINQPACERVCRAIGAIQSAGLQVGVVIGGGNIFRGIQLRTSSRAEVQADHMGMLATLFNGIALQRALQNLGFPATALSALECPRIVETYQWSKANYYLQQGKVLIFVGGTGNPCFTTDSAAALRACEIQADLLVKATKVDGVYSADPLKDPNAVKFSQISHAEVLEKNLGIMDSSAIALCRSYQIPIYVLNMQRLWEANPAEALLDFSHGTLIK